MTATKPRAPPKFEGELAEPILAPLDLSDDERSLVIGAGFYHVLEARLKKMAALARHYGVEPGDDFALAYSMACDLVPGFQVRYDDLHARALKLPDAYYGKGTKKIGSGALPEALNGARLILMFSLFERKFPTEPETKLADRIVLCMKPKLAGIAHEKARAKISKQLRNRLSKARRPAAADQ